MVVIGPSMGGCISQLLLTDSGNQLWMKIFGRPPDEVATLIIREPTLSSHASEEMLRVTNTKEEELKPKRRANSVDSLSPKSHFLRP
jgi:hypothetical protein